MDSHGAEAVMFSRDMFRNAIEIEAEYAPASLSRTALRRSEKV